MAAMIQTWTNEWMSLSIFNWSYLIISVNSDIWPRLSSMSAILMNSASPRYWIIIAAQQIFWCEYFAPWHHQHFALCNYDYDKDSVTCEPFGTCPLKYFRATTKQVQQKIIGHINISGYDTFDMSRVSNAKL